MVRGMPRDNRVAGDWSAKQTAGMEPRGSYVSTLTINEAALHNTNTNSTAVTTVNATGGRATGGGADETLLLMGEQMRDDGLSDVGGSDDPGITPAAGLDLRLNGTTGRSQSVCD